MPTQIVNILFILSGTLLSLLLSRGSIIYTRINVISSFIILVVLFFKFKILQKLSNYPLNKPNIILSIVFSLVVAISNSQRFLGKGQELIEKLGHYVNIPNNYDNLIINMYSLSIVIVAIFAAIFISFIYYWLFNSIIYHSKLFIKKMDKTEKIFLIAISVLISILVSVLFIKTNVFYGARYNGDVIDFDVIYNSDSGNLMETNVYMNINAPENDIRQPLFGLFAVSFGTVAWIISKIFFFLPNAYPITITIIQAILLQISILLIARLIAFDTISKLFFLLISLSLYPTMLFSFMAEQYIFALFWLIVFIYSCLNNDTGKGYLLIAAAGSLITSAILFPLLIDTKNIKQSIKALLKLALLFIIIVILAGQFQLLLVNILPIGGGWTIAGLLSSFGGTSIDFSNRLLQYINFVSLCIFRPDVAGISYVKEYVTWQLGSITTVNSKGMIILLLSIIGFVLNYKKIFARICMSWIFFSFLILCLIGWGTTENGLILYSLYFSWAFVSLIILGVERILSKYSMIKYSLYSVLFLTLLWINSNDIFKIISFGFDKYQI
jgi:hypothetical protein